MGKQLVLVLGLLMSTLAQAQGGVFTQISAETGTYQMKGASKTTPALGVDIRLGAHSRAWRDFYRYVGFGGTLYRLDSPNDISVDSDEFNGSESNTYVNVFAFGGLSLNAPGSPFVEVGLNGAEWLNAHYEDEVPAGQNGFIKAGLDLKSRSGGWLQIFYKVSTTQDVGPLRKLVTTGMTAGWAF